MNVVYSKSGITCFKGYRNPITIDSDELIAIWDEVQKGNPAILYIDERSNLVVRDPKRGDAIFHIRVRGDVIFVPDGNGWMNAYTTSRCGAMFEKPDVVTMYKNLIRDSHEVERCKRALPHPERHVILSLMHDRIRGQIGIHTDVKLGYKDWGLGFHKLSVTKEV